LTWPPVSVALRGLVRSEGKGRSRVHQGYVTQAVSHREVIGDRDSGDPRSDHHNTGRSGQLDAVEVDRDPGGYGLRSEVELLG
jgi:hypothetical protein